MNDSDRTGTSGARVEEAEPERLGWLLAARQQSQALAEIRAAHATPFVWESATRRRSHRRPLWLTASLAGGLLCLATITLATLHHGWRRPPARGTVIAPLGTTTGPSALAAPRSAAAQPAAAKSSTAPKKPPRRRPRLVVKHAAPAAQAPSTQAAAATTPDHVSFEGDEPGATIIVTPPPQTRVPLWTPEEYRKQRAGKLRW